jgi:hypothetical protein
VFLLEFGNRFTPLRNTLSDSTQSAMIQSTTLYSGMAVHMRENIAPQADFVYNLGRHVLLNHHQTTGERPGEVLRHSAPYAGDLSKNR